MKPPRQGTNLIPGVCRRLAVALGLGIVLVASCAAQSKFKVLHVFRGPDGSTPWGGVIGDKEGNLYGTTRFGGAIGYGTVFKLDAKGHETVLHSFAGPDGGNPWYNSSLILDAAGTLYGMAYAGGAYDDGTIYKTDRSGKFTVLYNFAGPDGNGPMGPLLLDSAGTLYGTTTQGGVYGDGTVFKLDTSGTETVLYSFTGGANGAEGNPMSGVIRDAKGNFYGVASGNALGAVFKMDTVGKVTFLHYFPTGQDDGYYAQSGMVRDAKGNLYGATYGGGIPRCPGNGCGVVYKLSPAGKETLLHMFFETDGWHSESTLIRDAAGNLYGSTIWGGAYGNGEVFKVDAKGHETILHSFTNTGKDGAIPSGTLFLDGKGNLYGTTQGDAYNSCGCGTVFRLSR